MKKEITKLKNALIKLGFKLTTPQDTWEEAGDSRKKEDYIWLDEYTLDSNISFAEAQKNGVILIGLSWVLFEQFYSNLYRPHFFENDYPPTLLRVTFSLKESKKTAEISLVDYGGPGALLFDPNKYKNRLKGSWEEILGTLRCIREDMRQSLTIPSISAPLLPVSADLRTQTRQWKKFLKSLGFNAVSADEFKSIEGDTSGAFCISYPKERGSLESVLTIEQAIEDGVFLLAASYVCAPQFATGKYWPNIFGDEPPKYLEVVFCTKLGKPVTASIKLRGSTGSTLFDLESIKKSFSLEGSPEKIAETLVEIKRQITLSLEPK